MRIKVFIILIIIKSLDGFTQVLYKRTSNLTQESWSKMKLKSLGTKSVSVCGSACAKNSPQCNSFHFSDSDKMCQLGKVTYLEDTDGGPTASVHVDVQTIATVDQICRGGDHCCNDAAFSLCQPGEGDCNKDTDCKVGAVCSKGACTTIFAYSGGLWDPNDDCCERACTPAHPCKHGLGICETSDDCEGGNAFECSECLGPRFLESDFPGIGSVGYNSTDKCCRKLCLPSEPCSYKQIGCQLDTDCMPGLFCNGTLFCDDIDECLLDQNLCGQDQVCINIKGAYSNPDISKGYRCVEKEEEKVAVVLGGRNCRVSPCAYTTGVEVWTRHKKACLNHTIPTPHFYIQEAAATFVKGYIVICGGYSSPADSSYLLGWCHILNMNVHGSTWKGIQIFDTRRAFAMTELNDRMYMIGGYYDWNGGGAHSSVYRFNVETEKFVRVADRRATYWHTACSTKLLNEIWAFGGEYSSGTYTSVIDAYSPATNSWRVHSYLYTGMIGVACAVVKNSKDDHEWMIHAGGGTKSYTYRRFIKYWDLTTNEGWTSLEYMKSSVYHRLSTFLTLSPYEAFLVGTENTNKGWGKIWAWDEYEHSISQFWRGEMEEDHWRGVAIAVPADSALVKYCFESDCPAGYKSTGGDVDGLGSIETISVETREECAAKCTDNQECGSFEHSHTEKLCSLNKEKEAVVPTFKDYVFCVKQN